MDLCTKVMQPTSLHERTQPPSPKPSHLFTSLIARWACCAWSSPWRTRARARSWRQALPPALPQLHQHRDAARQLLVPPPLPGRLHPCQSLKRYLQLLLPTQALQPPPQERLPAQQRQLGATATSKSSTSTSSTRVSSRGCQLQTCHKGQVCPRCSTCQSMKPPTSWRCGRKV